MAAKTKHGLPETKGVYQAVGVVKDTLKENFYNEIVTKTNKDMRLISFGLEINKGKSLYLGLSGMVRDFAYFSKKEDGKNVTEKVDWDKRDTFTKEKGNEDFNLIGMRLGLEKNEDGKNEKKTMVEYDACQEISQKLEDGKSVFTKGKVEFNSYFDKDGNKKRSVKLVPQQISLTSKDIDFSNEEFEPKSDFSQYIVFMGIEKGEDDTFKVLAKIVTYSSIEDAEFIVKDKALANQFKKGLKPYHAIQVHGHIEVTESVDEVQEEDSWGESDPTKMLNAPVKRDYVITGATPSTIETSVYTESAMNEAIQKLQQTETATQDWGTTSNDADDDEW